MANTTTDSSLVVTKFLSDFFKEYVRDNRFSRYTGTSSNNVIVIKEGRQTINIPLVTRLTGNGVSGSQTLRGNGEQLGNYGHDLVPTYKRHAVEMTKEENEKPAIDLMKASRETLMTWAMEETRDDVIAAMGAIYNGTTYSSYADATEAAKDTWLANNSDRVLFGAVKSNNSSNDHSASLANVDSTTDVMDAGIVSLSKRMAKTADPHIRPIRTKEDEEWYVMFANSMAFRDLKTDSTILQANREAWSRGRDNPIFRDGDIIYDGVIIREVPEIAVISGVGASSIDVAPCYLCGAQAIGFGLVQRPDIIVDRDYDYGFQPGVAVELKHDIDKLFFNNVQHGLLTVYVSGVADS